MKDEPPVHELEHAEPTVIHHHDEDMTILARWLKRGMERGAGFWLPMLGVLAALIGGAVALGALSVKGSANSQAWIDLIPAKTPEDRLKVAEAYAKTPVADWARLYAANEEYEAGLIALTDPKQRDIAGPRLKKALETYRQVAAEAPKDSSQARGAAFGVARTLEARNELDDAIKQYRLVAETWKGSPEAKQSESLAKALDDPENRMFYKELYAFKPPATNAATPPSGTPPPLGGLDIKSILSNLPGGGPMDIAPPPTTNPLTTPPPASPEPAKPETAPEPAKAEPKPETAPATPAAPAPAPAPKAELPADSFSPSPK